MEISLSYGILITITVNLLFLMKGCALTIYISACSISWNDFKITVPDAAILASVIVAAVLSSIVSNKEALPKLAEFHNSEL